MSFDVSRELTPADALGVSAPSSGAVADTGDPIVVVKSPPTNHPVLPVKPFRTTKST